MDERLKMMMKLLLEQYGVNPSAECGVSLYLKQNQDIDGCVKYGINRNPVYPQSSAWADEHIIIYSTNDQKIVSVTDSAGSELGMIELIDKLRSF